MPKFDDQKYFIIETPPVIYGSINTYNLMIGTNILLQNNINYNSKSSIYYSDIVSNDNNYGCSRFNTGNMLNIQPLTTNLLPEHAGQR